jgi:hypothetical protein
MEKGRSPDILIDDEMTIIKRGALALKTSILMLFDKNLFSFQVIKQIVVMFNSLCR